MGFGVRFRIALAGRALRVSMFEMTGSEMIGRVPSESFAEICGDPDLCLKSILIRGSDCVFRTCIFKNPLKTRYVFENSAKLCYKSAKICKNDYQIWLKS